ncbi:MAG: hypothetical protein J1E83_05215 [Lachnospiraceae bacterium]|nr:hypothetical protein [Lachnospiraceae bacterium]
MKYSISRILHNLFRNGLLYLFILLSFTLGAGLFIICMNFRMTGAQLLAEVKRQSAEGVIKVQWSYQSEFDPLIDPIAFQQERTDYPIPYDTYLDLISNPEYTDELDFLYALKTDTTVFIRDTEDVLEWDVYFMNEYLFHYLYGFPRNEGMAYLGDTAYADLLLVGNKIKSGDDFFFTDFAMYIDGDSLIIDGKSYPYEVVMPLEPYLNLLTIGESPDTDIEELERRFGGPMHRSTMNIAVILPIEDVFTPSGDDANTMNNLLLRYRNAEWHEDVVAQVLRELNQIDRKSRFTVENRYLTLKSRMEDYSYDMDRWMLVAVSILFLSGVGCIGSMYLLLDKRRHFMAVSIAYGSTLWRVVAETVAELLIVLSAGCILGILILPILQKITVYQGELRVNMGGIGIVAMTVLTFSMISVLLGMHAVRLKDVAAVLKEE